MMTSITTAQPKLMRITKVFIVFYFREGGGEAQLIERRDSNRKVTKPWFWLLMQ